MMRNLIRLFIIVLCLHSFNFIYSQVSQEIIDKARQAGVPEEQINQELRKIEQSGGSSDSGNAPDGQVERSLSVAEHLNPSGVSHTQQDLTGVVFGREIFTNRNLSFEPDLNIPTPKGYRLAAGDELLIHVWGDSEMNMNRTISPDGTIIIPNLGPIALSGLTIEAAEVHIRQELGRIMATITNGEANTFVSVSLGKIRSLKVNIVGEVLSPGTYTLPSFATLFNALYAAGGVNDIGSLRNIKVYRDSREVAKLDVYDYLLNGKYDSNIRLENNDMIIVGPYDQLVRISGNVKRNRIFELKEGETLQHLINMAGGFKGDAYLEEVTVNRRAGDRLRIATVSKDKYHQFSMVDGDHVSVNEVLPFYENRLQISGAVWRPGSYELTPEVNTVKQLILKAKGLKGDEFAHRGQITRLNEDLTYSMIAVDIEGIMKGNSPDITLRNEDQLYIPSIFDLRETYSVRIRGAVNSPGDFPYRHNMTVEDLIVHANGLKESASTINVEVARRIKKPEVAFSSDQTAELYTFTLSEDLSILIDNQIFTLEPFDEVYVRYSPQYTTQQVVQIGGEITFVGDYVLSEKNSRLSDLVKKAGGLTPGAYIKGANLKRKVSEDELRRLETLLDMSTNQHGNDSIAVSSIDLSVYSVGIDLQKALNHPGSSDDLVLQDGDELYIPQLQNTVKISGSVNYPNSVTFSDHKNVKNYISQAGGYLDVARKYPIVIYMNGMVATTKKTGIFFKKYPKVEPGCEIIVPARTYSSNKMSPMEIMSIASSTTSMAAMVTAVINTLSNNNK